MGDIKRYAIVTAAYWGFTITDGALRMLVLLYFHTLGYSPFELAFLFVLYEFFGVITNLVGGWIGARFGLRITLHLGLGLQIVALSGLALLQPDWTGALAIAYVVAFQGLAGIAKDLTKMSAKSAIKLVVPAGQQGTLFRWVALLTGSKNALKGVGFFIGTVLLAGIGFSGALVALAIMLVLVWAGVLVLMRGDLGRASSRPKFRALMSKSSRINLLSAARFLLFGARDVWFVVGVPIFAYDVLGWRFVDVGAFLALWVIGYGMIQASAPVLVRRVTQDYGQAVLAARLWAFILAVTPLLIVAILPIWQPDTVLIVGLALFGAAFAVNSSLHSYLIVAFADRDQVSLDVGFYYMANAGGRLVGALLSGLIYQVGGLTACLVAAAVMVLGAGLVTLLLPVGAPDRKTGSATQEA